MYWWRPSYFWGGVLVVAGVLALLANLHLLVEARFSGGSVAVDVEQG